MSFSSTAADIKWIQPYTDKLGDGKDVSVDAIEKAITELDRGGTDSADIIISSAAQWRAVSKELRGKEQFHNSNMADAGFRNFMVESVPMFYLYSGYVAKSSHATNNASSLATPWDSDYVAVLNSKYLKLIRHSTDWMENYGFQQKNRTPVWEALLRSVCVFACTGRRYQALIAADNRNLPNGT